MRRNAGLDWNAIERELDREGYAVLPRFIAPDEAARLAAVVDVAAEEARSGLWAAVDGVPPDDAGLSTLLDACSELYRSKLMPIAARWQSTMDIGYDECALRDWCEAQGRTPGARTLHATPSLLRAPQFEPLRRGGDGPMAFPLQLVALLSEPDADFVGGQFVMTEQRPRMQSRPMVVPLRQGDLAVIASGLRPFKGREGQYRVTTRHAISRVRSGRRAGLEISLPPSSTVDPQSMSWFPERP